MLTIFLKYMSSAIMVLKCLQETWLGPGIKKDEHLAIISLTSWWENKGHFMGSYCVISSRNLLSVWQFLAKLYKLYRAFHSDLRVLRSCPLYMIVLMVGSNFFLTQFMRYHSCLFEVVIFCILSSKNFLLTNWTDVLKVFQLAQLL